MTKNEQTQNKINEENIASKKRTIVIETDGKNFELTKSEVSLLELREICRQIITRTGGI